MPLGSRRPLGGHVKAGEKVPRAYSRDELAAPLRLLSRVYADIRCGIFRPDETRSGMIDDPDGDNQNKLDMDKGVDMDKGGAVDGQDAVGVSDSESDSAGEAQGDDVDGPGGDLNNAEFVIHASSLVKHVVGPQLGSVACGRALSDAFRPCVADLPVCQRCTAALVSAARAADAQRAAEEQTEPPLKRSRGRTPK